MTLPPSRQSAFESAPMNDLLDILLRQFKRPLANFDIDLTPRQITAIAEAAAARQPLSEEAARVRGGLVKVVQESEAWFRARDLTFQRAMQTEMGDMPGWETTAEFLELANAKSNAELRVSAASTLLLALGEHRFADYVFFLLEHPELDDVSAAAARRVLAFVTQTEDADHDAAWLEQARRKLLNT